jgi:hypothetical protein
MWCRRCLNDAAWRFAATLCEGQPLVTAFAGAADTGADALLTEHLAAGRFVDFRLAPPEDVTTLTASTEVVL